MYGLEPTLVNEALLDNCISDDNRITDKKCITYIVK